MEVGDPSAPEFETAASLAASLDMPAATCRLYLERGWERFHAGAVDDALDLAQDGIQIAEGAGFRPLRAELLLLTGVSRTVARRTRADEFLDEALDEALVEAQVLRMPRLEWEVLQAVAALRELQGGEDLTGAIFNQAATSPAAYAESYAAFYKYGWAKQRSLTTPAWKYIDSTVPELFDRVQDPGEMRTSRLRTRSRAKHLPVPRSP